VWVLHRSGRASALWLPATILLTGFGQVHILVGMSCLLPLPRFWKSTLGPLRRGNPARPAHNPMKLPPDERHLARAGSLNEKRNNPRRG
jgi:hypothetical protein